MPWKGASDNSSRWQYFVGINAPQSHTPPTEPLRTIKVVRAEESAKSVLPEKGVFHNFVISSCTSRKKGTGGERGSALHSDARNQLSNRTFSGQGRGVHTSLMYTVAQASMAANSASALDWAITPKGGIPSEFQKA